MSKLALLFVMLFLGGIYAIMAKGAVFGFYVYELVYFLNPATRWWISNLPRLPYSFIIVLLTLTFFMLKRKEHTRNTLENMPEAKWFVMVFLSFCLVALYAQSSLIHNKYLFDLFKLYLIMWVAYRLIDTDKKLDMALYCYCLGAAYIGYEAMRVGRNYAGRVEGIGMVDAPEANATAAAIAPAVIILIYYGWVGNIKQKVFAALCAAFVVNAVVLINSRGSFLAVAAGFAYFIAHVLFSKYKLPYQRFMAIMIILVSAAAGLRLADDSFWDRLETLETASSQDADESGGRRINFWIATFDLLDDHPFGVGVFGYQILSPNYLHDESFFTSVGGQKMRAVHSLWFQGLSEIGWHGFIFFILMLLSLAKHLRRAKKLAVAGGGYRDYYHIIALEGALGAFLTAGTFIDAFRAEILYWLILFCICISNNVIRKYEHASPQKA